MKFKKKQNLKLNNQKKKKKTVLFQITVLCKEGTMISLLN